MPIDEILARLREIDGDWPKGYVFTMRGGRTLSLREIIEALEDKLWGQ